MADLGMPRRGLAGFGMRRWFLQLGMQERSAALGMMGWFRWGEWGEGACYFGFLEECFRSRGGD